MTSSQVKFNIGGVEYEISRDVLSRHPDSMLTTMASQRWNPSDSTDTSEEQQQQEEPPPLMIYRNGARFVYVLEFLNTGRVHLPRNLARAAFLEEADFYCLRVPDGAVTQQFELLDAATLIRQRSEQYKAQMRSYQADLQRHKEAMIQVNRKAAYTQVAHHWYMRYALKNTHRNDEVQFRFDLSANLPNDRKAICSALKRVFVVEPNVNLALFRDVLEPYALYYAGHRVMLNTDRKFMIAVKMKPLEAGMDVPPVPDTSNNGEVVRDVARTNNGDVNENNEPR